MQIVYLTIDDMNENLALWLAEECDVEIEPRMPKDWPPRRPPDALIYDLDSLSPDWREQILAELSLRRPGCPTAVHSHNLDGQADALCENGVIVRRRLGRELLLALCLAAGEVPARLRAIPVAPVSRRQPESAA